MKVQATQAESPLLRPRDEDVLRSELRTVVRTWSSPVVVFGGSVSNDTLKISETYGTRTPVLRGLVISPRSGLGGRAMMHCAPQWVDDYAYAPSITHEYDKPVISEGMRAIVAVPVVVGGRSRAVIYAGVREPASIGGRTCDLLVRAGNRVGSEIALRDEVDQRLRLLNAASTQSPRDTAMTEGIREIHSELRHLAESIPDGPLRQSLWSVTEKLVYLTTPNGPSSEVTLSGREVDVLSYVALGCGNTAVAQRLSIKAETVKSYLRSAMGKLDVHSRHEAVVKARKLGLLP